jgi:predicted O-methyltransferase YrrM
MALDIEKALAIQGWMSEEELTWLATNAASAAIVIEIGSFQGRSTRALGDHCQGTVYAVDPWERYLENHGAPHDLDQSDDTFRQNLCDLIDAGKVPVKGLSKDVLGSGVLEPADLIFLDGDHRYETVLWELVAYSRLLRPGGIMSGHDYYHPSCPGVRQAVDDVFGPANVNHCGNIWWVGGAH